MNKIRNSIYKMHKGYYLYSSFLILFLVFIPILVDGHENFLRLINPKVCKKNGETRQCSCYDKTKDQCCNGLCTSPLVCMSDGPGECACVPPTCPEIRGPINVGTCSEAFCPDSNGEVDPDRFCKPNDSGTRCICSSKTCEDRDPGECSRTICPINGESCIEFSGSCQCLRLCSDSDARSCGSSVCPDDEDKICQLDLGLCTCQQGTCTDFKTNCDTHTCLAQPSKNCVFRDGDEYCSCASCVCSATTCNDNNPLTIDRCQVNQNGECVCTYDPACVCSATTCNDNNPQTVDTCRVNQNGECVCTHACVCSATTCDDGDPDTTDTCDDSQNGVCTCTHDPACVCSATTCDDGDPDTTDTCDDSQNDECTCTNVPTCCSVTVCDDNNDDTTDTCTENGGLCYCVSYLKGCQDTAVPSCAGGCGSGGKNATTRNVCMQISATNCGCIFEGDVCGYVNGVVRNCEDLICGFKSGSMTRNLCQGSASSCSCSADFKEKNN